MSTDCLQSTSNFKEQSDLSVISILDKVKAHTPRPFCNHAFDIVNFKCFGEASLRIIGETLGNNGYKFENHNWHIFRHIPPRPTGWAMVSWVTCYCILF